MLIVIQFARYGPYHHARLRSAQELLEPSGWEVVGLETAGTDATYAWDETQGSASGPRVVTAFPGRVYEEITAKECRSVLHPLLDSLNPDAIAIAGWGSVDALACLSWARKRNRRRIVMSETREADGTRVWYKELVKRVYISRFHGALVGGRSHRDYLIKLGMPGDKIAFGYNVVDNAVFGKAESRKLKVEVEDPRLNRAAHLPPIAPTSSLSETPPSGLRNSLPLPCPLLPASCFLLPADAPHLPPIAPTSSLSETPASGLRNSFHLPYFLASNRFIDRKNLHRLIDAYALYLQSSPSPWPFVLLGDGDLKPSLLAHCKSHGIKTVEGAPWPEPNEPSPSPAEASEPSEMRFHQCEASPHPTKNKEQSTSNFSSLSSFKIQNSKFKIVYFPGFRQINELPTFYARAGCFIHPALEEPWGLVLNEAMASGLPVLSSNNVGAAEELIDEGVNGWTFDPTDVNAMAECLARVSSLPEAERRAMGDACRRVVEERCPTRAFGKGLAKLLLDNSQ